MKAKMKMLVSLVCGTLLMAVVPMSAMAAWANPFKDVQPGAWYYGAVEYANTKGLFSGTAPDKFSPNDNITRGMFVKVLGSAAGLDTTGYTSSQFKDVPSNAYYAPYVAWAAEVGVVNGTSATTFSPENYITREDMATMLYKYARAYGYDTSYEEAKLLDFPDCNKISSYAQVPMAWAVTHGVLAGSDGYLNPKGYATRAETAQIFYNSDALLSTQVSEPTLDRVWVVDEPGHYETVERLDLVEVIDKEEVGHWEDVFYTHWVYRCNQCGVETETEEEMWAHEDESIDAYYETGSAPCFTYTKVSSDPEYTGEQYWVVDIPAESHYELQLVKEKVWVEEVGHWEYK